jgi:hypothetical protein
MRANRDTAKDTFEALDEGMSRLQAQIDQLQAQMNHLHTEKRALCARRNKLAPLCQLPADVLYHIIDLAFTQAIDIITDTTGSPRSSLSMGRLPTGRE